MVSVQQGAVKSLRNLPKSYCDSWGSYLARGRSFWISRYFISEVFGFILSKTSRPLEEQSFAHRNSQSENPSHAFWWIFAVPTTPNNQLVLSFAKTSTSSFPLIPLGPDSHVIVTWYSSASCFNDRLRFHLSLVTHHFYCQVRMCML